MKKMSLMFCLLTAGLITKAQSWEAIDGNLPGSSGLSMQITNNLMGTQVSYNNQLVFGYTL